MIESDDSARTAAPPAHLPTRRDLLRHGSALGLCALGLPRLDARACRVPAPRRDAPAQAVVHVFLGGGLSHIDTFDPKPDAPVEVRGPFRAIGTKLDGERLSELLPHTATVADRLVIVRSLTHGEAAHERGVHSMVTGQKPSPAITYPSMGAVVAHQLGGRRDLPPYVCVPNAGVDYLGTGYLGSAYGPFNLGSEPNQRGYEVRDLAPAKDVDGTRLDRRRRMLADFDAGFDGVADSIDATGAFYEQAWRLIDSEPARAAFRIDAEKGELRDAYGRTNIGQRLLLARRLVEAGVRWVTVVDGGYDHHRDLQNGLRARMAEFDRGFAKLIADLDARGLLATTIVVVTTEFGRTPRFNADRGRDHWPRVFSGVIAGGGLRRGVVLGRSDANGAEPEDAPVSPADIAATVFTQLGIDPTARLMSPGDRPIDIVRDGRVLAEIVS